MNFLPEYLKQPTSWKLPEHRHRTSSWATGTQPPANLSFLRSSRSSLPFEPRLPTPLMRSPLVSWARNSACWRVFSVVSRGSVPAVLACTHGPDDGAETPHVCRLCVDADGCVWRHKLQGGARVARMPGSCVRVRASATHPEQCSCGCATSRRGCSKPAVGDTRQGGGIWRECAIEKWSGWAGFVGTQRQCDASQAQPRVVRDLPKHTCSPQPWASIDKLAVH